MMNNASLRQFLDSASTCVETASLEEIWRVFQTTPTDWIVVLDQQQAPLGVLGFRQLTLNLPISSLLEASRSSSPQAHSPLVNLKWESIKAPAVSPDWSQPLATHPLRSHLEPIALLPVDWQLEQFLPYLQQNLQSLEQHWALVNANGQFVGLLDRFQLLQALAGQALHLAQFAPASAARSAQSITAQSGAELENATAPEPELAALSPLIDLLERLPLPLMLQTATGRVITHNLAWRQQVEELRDPGQVRREAAVILEAAQENGETTPLAKSEYLGVDAMRSMSSCHYGTEPNSCVCICPMRNGQERVWKFLKVPMGIASLSLSAIQVAEDGAASGDRSFPISSFKLATLGFSPDPSWRSLAQTEFLWLVLAQDMTEQQQIARELAAKNADLVQLNRLKDEFLSCISHELKTPLTAVLGLSSLLKDQMLGELNERQSRYARLIYQSGRHLILIVNDILDLTRIETGQLDLILETVAIESVCQEAYDQARQATVSEDGTTSSRGSVDLPAAVVPFTLEIQPGLESIVADEMRLRQMLGNLLSNALKFTAPDREIGLRVEAWEGWIAFTVWDTGIGIPADKQHLIFQKFQQLENPMTRQFEGTGLGLVLTQRLARLHGGDVTFTSEEGRGSQFTLLLPPIPPQMNVGFHSETAVRSPSITAENRLVLVVESNPNLIDQLSDQLTQLGYRVAIARSGTEALEKSRRLQPAIIFLNPLLPMLSGWDVLTLLKADEATRHIPLAVTASRLEREQALQSGANSFLSLPVQADSLQRCLERSINLHSEPTSDRSSNLTILHLNGSTYSHLDGVGAAQPGTQDLTQLLHPHRCRVLEIDDLEQADLLARVWKPHVILIDGSFPDPFCLMKQLSQHPALASLPLVTLTPEITHAANLVPGLMIFPCLASSPLAEPDADPDVAALWQVIQVAAGVHWTPHILLADLSVLEENWVAAAPSDLRQSLPATAPTITSQGLQALVHYLQVAGFRCSMGQSWQEVVQQLHHRSIDLVLFCIHTPGNLHLFLEIAQTLEQLEMKPPILVWNCQPRSAAGSDMAENFETIWGTIASRILPNTVSMPDLLSQINQILTPC